MTSKAPPTPPPRMTEDEAFIYEAMTTRAAGRWTNFIAYIEFCIEQAGGVRHLGREMDFSAGSRISDWRNAKGGRPSILNCLKLAKLTADDPLDVLYMTGHDEAIELLKHFFARGARPVGALALMQVDQALEHAEDAIRETRRSLSTGDK